MKKEKILILFISLISATTLFAQNLNVGGVVVDKKTGEALLVQPSCKKEPAMEL